MDPCSSLEERLEGSGSTGDISEDMGAQVTIWGSTWERGRQPWEHVEAL
jgi:hypothetical protein